MKTMKRYLIAGAGLILMSLGCQAQTPASHPGPYLPPGLRTPSPDKPASGQALRSEAMLKLQRRFEEADLDASGSLTRDEARRAGLGFVDSNFDQIDSAGKGTVSFDDVRKFMAQRRR